MVDLAHLRSSMAALAGWTKADAEAAVRRIRREIRRANRRAARNAAVSGRNGSK